MARGLKPMPFNMMRSRVAKSCVAISILFLATSFSGLAKADDCGTYPAEVHNLVYGGFSDCTLQQAGEKPLWHGLTQSGALQQIRFTFTEGHSLYTKVINFDEQADGSGTIRLRTIRHDPVKGLIVSSQKSRRVTSDEVAKIDSFGLSSGTWEHAIGTWDENEVFLHCETLDMERVTHEGYRFASVNISCNQPEKLMPFVQFITGLVDLKPFADRQMY